MKKFFIVIFFLALQARSNQIKVLQVIAGPEVTLAENKKIKIVKNTVLNNEVRFKTGQNQFVQLQLGSFYQLSILDHSDVVVELKNTDTPLALYIINLRQGQIYLKNMAQAEDKKLEKSQSAELKLKSVFFDWLLPAEQNIDLLLELKTEEPLVRFCNRDKEFQVALFDHEKKITLKTLEGVQFQGVNESKNVVYDILLNGRKIPKGHWLPMSKCNFDEIQQKELDFLKAEQSEAEKSQQKIRKIKVEKQVLDARFLCHNPYGQFNDCSWVLQSGRCQKTRCNAEGKWTSSELISIAEAPQCTSKPFVAKCDN